MKQKTIRSYKPRMSAAHQARLRKWHEAPYQGIRSRLPLCMSYLGLELYIPEDVFPPTPMSELLGRAVLDEVGPSDRVLDMGTGSGVNAILAASMSRDVVGVDVNPRAVASAIANAERNRVAARTTFLQSDVFGAVVGTFDLIVFDPPSQWFAPRDLLEAAITDENYRTVTRFVTEASDYLNVGGRILVFFGTSGDLEYLYDLADQSGFTRRVVDSRRLARGGVMVSYYTLRLTM